MTGSEPIALRRATPGDVPALAALYTACARTLGPQVYGPEQVAVWAAFGSDAEGFARYVLEPETWVATNAGDVPVGFAGADAHGEVRSLYVHPDHGRRGLGTQLLAQVLVRCRECGHARLQAWVTPFSLPLFERAGFELIATMQSPYHGVLFERYRVERVDDAGPSAEAPS